MDEIVKRLALAFNGGSYANDYARKWTEKKVVDLIFNGMTPNDCDAIKAELVKIENAKVLKF